MRVLDLLPLILSGGSFSRVSSNGGAHQYSVGYSKWTLCRSSQFPVFLSLFLVLCSANANCPVLPAFSALSLAQLHVVSPSLCQGLENLSRWEAGKSLVSPFCAPSLRDHCPLLSNVQCLVLGIFLLRLDFFIYKGE